MCYMCSRKDQKHCRNIILFAKQPYTWLVKEIRTTLQPFLHYLQRETPKKKFAREIMNILQITKIQYYRNTFYPAHFEHKHIAATNFVAKLESLCCKLWYKVCNSNILLFCKTVLSFKNDFFFIF